MSSTSPCQSDPFLLGRPLHLRSPISSPRPVCNHSGGAASCFSFCHDLVHGSMGSADGRSSCAGLMPYEGGGL